LSGIKFDTAGFRTEFQDIINLGNEGLYKVGKWKTNFGFQWKPGYRIPGVDDNKSLRDKHFLVLISLVCSNNVDVVLVDVTLIKLIIVKIKSCQRKINTTFFS